MGEMPFRKEIEAETAGQAEERAVELAQRVADADLTVRQVSPIEVKADSPAAAKKAAEKELGGSFTATRATQIKDQS